VQDKKASSIWERIWKLIREEVYGRRVPLVLISRNPGESLDHFKARFIASLELRGALKPDDDSKRSRPHDLKP
jgi:hypothetical protein